VFDGGFDGSIDSSWSMRLHGIDPDPRGEYQPTGLKLLQLPDWKGGFRDTSLIESQFVRPVRTESS
jgi:hypothetical protein